MDILDTFAALPRSARLGCGIPAFFRKTLPSGLLSVQVWVKTGSIHEEEFLGGGLSQAAAGWVFGQKQIKWPHRIVLLCVWGAFGPK